MLPKSQFPLHPESQPYTAFTWGSREQYMFTACPFGLLNMPSHFQRVMQFVFRDLSFTFPYFDNIPFGSHSWEEHQTHTLAIIERLNHYNLKLKPSAIKIGQAQLNCLGHMVTPTGIGVAPDILAKILDWPRPITGKQLASFLGLITFVRQHVRHFADLTAELEALKRTKGNIIWTPVLEHCFTTVRHAIAHAPLLCFPDFNKPFYIATDTSSLGIGRVLYQPLLPDENIDGNNIVAICSKKLNETQQRYSTYKKELYAIVYCLRQFHAYVWGHQPLVIVTDHMPLTYILTSAILAHALQGWLDVILDYHFTIKHRPGILHVLPDALSRMYEACYSNVWGAPTHNPQDIIQQRNLAIDKDVLVAMSQPPLLADTKRNRHRTIISASASRGGEMKIQFSNSDADSEEELDMESKYDSEEMTSSDEKTQDEKEVKLLVELERRGKTNPSSDRERLELIDATHIRGHFGRDMVYRSLYWEGYWWPGMRNTIQERIRECLPCLRYNISKQGFDPAIPITAALPFDHVQIDHSTRLPTSTDGMTALMVIVDVCVGFVILRALPNTQETSVAPVLWQVFNDFGFPKVLQSDGGPEFVNRVIKEMIRISGVPHRVITPYNPRADGKVERNIGIAMSIIKKHLHGVGKSWTAFVPWTQSCINNRISELTGSTPFSLMFGRKFNPFKDYTSSQPLEAISESEWSKLQDRMMDVSRDCR